MTKQPLNFYFKPISCGFKDSILRVQPDILPADPLYIGAKLVQRGSFCAISTSMP
ncbi:MAG: hypothetical protein PUP91_06610 [Rhizonema sp. PD37]|nr:hypothetical protein [Rhizonema sp. PD37]